MLYLITWRCSRTVLSPTDKQTVKAVDVIIYNTSLSGPKKTLEKSVCLYKWFKWTESSNSLGVGE